MKAAILLVVLPLAAQTRHVVQPTPDQVVIGYYDAATPPVLRIHSGDTVEIHTLGVGMHNFMDAKKVAQADTDPVVKARLDSCVFKGAVKRNGEWVAVPMCSMNQQTWSEVYDGRLNDPELLKQAQVFNRVESEPASVKQPAL